LERRVDRAKLALGFDDKVASLEAERDRQQMAPREGIFSSERASTQSVRHLPCLPIPQPPLVGQKHGPERSRAATGQRGSREHGIHVAKGTHRIGLSR
jgi:hypothetical protein